MSSFVRLGEAVKREAIVRKMAAAKKTLKAVGRRKDHKGARGVKVHPSFARYIQQVLGELFENVGISKKGMLLMNSLVYDLFSRVGNEAEVLCKASKKQTLSMRTVATAIALALGHSDLAKHADKEGMRAVVEYSGTFTCFTTQGVIKECNSVGRGGRDR